MVLHAKRPALAILAGALWLATFDSAWAATSSSNREQFANLLANRQNQNILNRLERQLGLLHQLGHQLQQQQKALTGTVTTQSRPTFFVQLHQLDIQFQLQQTRITQRLESLNNLVGNPAVNQKALGRLRTELTRLDTAIGQRLQTVQRIERASATPFAPGAF
jgi:hypothetical protein